MAKRAGGQLLNPVKYQRIYPTGFSERKLWIRQDVDAQDIFFTTPIGDMSTQQFTFMHIQWMKVMLASEVNGDWFAMGSTDCIHLILKYVHFVHWKHLWDNCDLMFCYAKHAQNDLVYEHCWDMRPVSMTRMTWVDGLRRKQYGFSARHWTPVRPWYSPDSRIVSWHRDDWCTPLKKIIYYNKNENFCYVDISDDWFSGMHAGDTTIGCPNYVSTLNEHYYSFLGMAGEFTSMEEKFHLLPGFHTQYHLDDKKTYQDMLHDSLEHETMLQ